MPKQDEALIEATLENCLSDAAFRAGFLRCIDQRLARPLRMDAAKTRVDQQPRPFGDADARLDLLLTGGRRALLLELKADSAENLHQYLNYREGLEAEGYDTRAVGIIGRRRKKRGYKAKVEAFFDETADARMTWADLLRDLRAIDPKLPRLSEMETQIRALKLDNPLPPPEFAPDRHDLADLPHSPATLRAFFEDVHARLPADLDGRIEQPGNAPVMWAFGHRRYADWVGDNLVHRFQLMFEESRPKKELDEPHFTFGIMCFRRDTRQVRADGGWSISRRLREQRHLAMLLRHCRDNGMDLCTNKARKWHSHERLVDFHIDLDRAKFVVAHDVGNFRLDATDYLRLGWDAATGAVATRAREILAGVDALMAEED